MSHSRPIRLPAADFDLKPLPVSAVGARDTFRVHSVRFPAVSFRLNPDHRFSHPKAPGGLLYLGEDIETCLWECFGDEILNHSAIAKVDWGKRLSKIAWAIPLKVCDLTLLSVRRTLGLDLSAMKHTELDVPQAWGLAIQNHPAKVDGLRYLSRFTGSPCIALFECPGLAARLRETRVSLLAELDTADDFLNANSIALV
jgi:RES domain